MSEPKLESSANIGLARSSTNWDPSSYYCDPKIAATYDRDRFSSMAGAVYVRLERRALLRALSVVPRGSQVLDLPCGTGRLAEILLENGYRVIGADISQEMLNVAQERLRRFGDRFSWEIRDARLGSRAEKRFPLVLFARVLMHFPLEEQIAFLKGVVALSSKYVVITHSFDSAYQRARRYAKRLMLGATAPAAHPIGDAAIRRLLAETSLREIRRIRLLPLVSEAVIIVAERSDRAEELPDQSK